MEVQSKREIKKEILTLIIPIVIENILQIMAGIVSVALVGRLSTLDISAQGVAFRITDTLFVLWKGIAVGGMVFMARCYGEGKLGKCKQAFQNIAIATVFVGAICQLALWIYPTSFLSLVSDDVEVLSIASNYMNIVCIGIPFIIIIQIVASTFQAFGNTKTPMLIAMLINIVNIVMGYTLIYGLDMGLNGAAVATVLSQIIGALAGVYLLYKRNGLFRNIKEKISIRKIDKHILKETYSTGIPASLESMFWQLSTIILTKILLTYGQNEFAAYSLSTQAETIIELPILGFSVAATTLAAKAIGKRDQSLFNEYFKQQVKMNMTVSAVGSAILIFMPTLLMSIVTDKPELQQIGVVYLIVMGIIQIPQSLARTFNGTIRAVGYKRVPMYIAGGVTFLVRLPLAALIAYVLKWDLIFIWIVIGIDQVLKCILTIMFMKSKNFNKILDEEHIHTVSTT